MTDVRISLPGSRRDDKCFCGPAQRLAARRMGRVAERLRGDLSPLGVRWTPSCSSSDFSERMEKDMKRRHPWFLYIQKGAKQHSSLLFTSSWQELIHLHTWMQRGLKLYPGLGNAKSTLQNEDLVVWSLLPS